MKTKIAQLNAHEYANLVQYIHDYGMQEMDMQSCLDNYNLEQQRNHTSIPTPQMVHTSTTNDSPQIELPLDDPYLPRSDFDKEFPNNWDKPQWEYM